MLFRFIIFGILLLSAGCQQNTALNQYDQIDLLIENANILDGNGNPAYGGNIYIVDGKIVHIDNEKITHPNILKVIDAGGKYVTPGFIDLHSHGNPKETPAFENFLAMGVTTITLGQDGGSPETENINTWKNEVNQQKLGVNIAMFIGHGTLRALAGVGNKAKASNDEMHRMEEILSHNLNYTFGLSTGLEYAPGLYAEESELIELAKIVGEKNRMIMSHMRNEDDDQIVGSIQELIRQGEHAQVHISHLKSVYGKGAARAGEILAVIKEASAGGINITADLYPYTASYTGISILFPDWCKTEEQFQAVKNTRRSELETFIRNKVNARNGPKATLMGTAPYAGKTLADLVFEFDKPFEDILIDDIGPGGASAAYFVMDDDLQTAFLADSIVSFCSDGSPTGFHPRGHGTFARILEEFVVNRGVLSLEEAIRKMTSYPADILGLADRGRIEVGKKADLVIFDLNNVKENATFGDPFQLAGGFDFVIVNGKLTRENGQLTNNFAGAVLNP